MNVPGGFLWGRAREDAKETGIKMSARSRIEWASFKKLVAHTATAKETLKMKAQEERAVRTWDLSSISLIRKGGKRLTNEAFI